MEKVQCDEPPIMKLGCLASLEILIYRKIWSFSEVCVNWWVVVIWEVIRATNAFSRKNANKHTMRVFCTALILLCWNSSFTSHNVQTLRDSWLPRCQFWRQKLISRPKSLAKSTHKHKSKLIQLKSIFHKMVDGCCWLVRTRGWNSIVFF